MVKRMSLDVEGYLEGCKYYKFSARRRADLVYDKREEALFIVPTRSV